MTTLTSEPVDLTSIAAEAVKQVQDLPLVDALAAFVNLSKFADYKVLVEHAQKSIEEFPLASLLSNVHLSGDGRVMHRGGPDESIYGVPLALWRQLSQSFVIHVGLTCQGLIVPAFNQLTQEHRLSTADCLTLARESAIVPASHEYLFARGLQLGFESDFAAAAHLLIPQVENLARFHLRDARILTSTVTQDGRENEDGLTRLAEHAEFVDVFGEDLAFGIRALFAGPMGPNLRNHAAHGLLDDSFATSMYGVYTWWFCLKLIFHPYWNRLRSSGTD